MVIKSMLEKISSSLSLIVFKNGSIWLLLPFFVQFVQLCIIYLAQISTYKVIDLDSSVDEYQDSGSVA